MEKYSTLCPMKHACLPTAHAKKDFPHPVLPSMSRFLRPVNEGAVHKLEQHLLAQVPLLRADDIFHNGVIAQFAGLQVHLSPLAVPVLLFGFGKPCH